MSKVIDIEVMVDTVTLLAAYAGRLSTNASAPTMIGNNYAYMVAPSVAVRSGQATSTLSINAEIGQTIRWRMLSLSGDADQAATIYDIRKLSGVQVTGPVQALLAHPRLPEPILVDGKNTNPPTYNVVTTQDDYYLSATITESGTENYQFVFYVTERRGTQLVLLSYFMWDPQIVVQ